MKNLSTLIGIMTMVFFSACTSLEKMVETGHYDQAIVKVAKKISGKKNKKTKDIKILESAFAKIIEEDLTRAANLKESGRASTWDEVFNAYVSIEERQELVRPFLPLVSKDGYKANFNFANVQTLKNEAADNAIVYHYNEAERLLNISENNSDKRAARRAYDELEYIELYTDRYKDSRNLKADARVMGTNRVLVQLHNNTFGFMPREVEQEIMSVNVHELNTFWTEYYTKKSINYDFDFVARLDLDEIAISPEREFIDRYVDESEVKDGWEYVLDEKGNVKKDSVGNDIKVDKFIKVFADVVEVHRTKEAIATGRFGLFDADTKELIETQPFEVTALFSDYASSIKGDKRAMCDRTRGRLKNRVAPFPSDLRMSLDVAHDLKELMKREMRKFSI